MGRASIPGPLVALALLAGCAPHERMLPAEALSATVGESEEAEPVPIPSVVPALPPEPEVELQPTPGFAIYTEHETIVIGYDGQAPLRAPGLWLQDDAESRGEIRAVTLAGSTELGLPGCACLGDPGLCYEGTLQTHIFDSSGALVEAPAKPCSCVAAPQPIGHGDVVWDGEFYEACAGAEDIGFVSLVGGRLYAQGWEANNACDGALNLYDALHEEHDLLATTDAEGRRVASGPAPDGKGMRSLGCSLEFGFPDVYPGWPIDTGSLLRDCEDYVEGEFYLLRRGALWEIGDNIAGPGGWRNFAKRNVSPDRCPSLNDPCGDPSPFHKPAKLHQRAREYWVGNAGDIALVAKGKRYELWSNEAEASEGEARGVALVRELELDVDATVDLLGVRAHADISRLRATMVSQATSIVPTPSPPTSEPAVCGADRACDPSKSATWYGNQCFTLLRVEQWAEAEAMCLCGLERAAPEDSVRGALNYNLGRIAQAQGAREQAIERYRASLEARPGNRTVARALARLEREGGS